MGLLIPGFTLSWAIAKEVNRPEHSGIATSVANTGIFLGTGILQPLVGWRSTAAAKRANWRPRGATASDPRGLRGDRRARVAAVRERAR